MKNLFSQIANLNYGITGYPLNQTDLTLFQNELSSAGYPSLPEEVFLFLLTYNGFCRESCCIWGINKQHNSLNDILSENNHSHNPTPTELLLLGSTDYCYVGYHKTSKIYSMIDKSTFMVLHNFKNFADTVRYILKIDD